MELREEVRLAILGVLAQSTTQRIEGRMEDAIKEIHRIYLKHGYGQRDEGAELPVVYGLGYNGDDVTQINLQLQAQQGMVNQGWHKDR